MLEEVLPHTDLVNCKRVKLFDFLGRESIFPFVKCYIRCPFCKGFIDAVRAPIKFCSVWLGNAPGVSNYKKIGTNSSRFDIIERERAVDSEGPSSLYAFSRKRLQFGTTTDFVAWWRYKYFTRRVF